MREHFPRGGPRLFSALYRQVQRGFLVLSILCLAPVFHCGSFDADSLYAGFLLTTSSGSSEAWVATDYSYRRKITFGTSHTILYNGYTVSLSMDTRTASTNVALSSGDDIRIYWQPSSGSALELDRICTNPNTASTTILFRLQSEISAGLDEDTDGSYYIYYGNSSAGTPGSAEANVYYFADFFNRTDSSVINGGWTEWNDGGGDMSIASNQLYIDPQGDNSSPQVGIKQTLALGAPPGNFEISLDWVMTTNLENTWTFYINVGDSTTMVNSSSSTGAGAGLYYCEDLGCSGVEGISNNLGNMLENNINGTQSFRLLVNSSRWIIY